MVEGGDGEGCPGGGKAVRLWTAKRFALCKMPTDPHLGRLSERRPMPHRLFARADEALPATTADNIRCLRRLRCQFTRKSAWLHGHSFPLHPLWRTYQV